jgi:hypothetical protein
MTKIPTKEYKSSEKDTESFEGYRKPAYDPERDFSAAPRERKASHRILLNTKPSGKGEIKNYLPKEKLVEDFEKIADKILDADEEEKFSDDYMQDITEARSKTGAVDNAKKDEKIVLDEDMEKKVEDTKKAIDEADEESKKDTEE